MNNKLENKVEARNRCNAVANLLVPRIFHACAPFMGQKVKTTQGDRTVKFNSALIAADFLGHTCSSDGSSTTQVWASQSYDLTVTVRVTFSADGKAYNAETVIYVGTLDGGTLVRLYAPPVSFKADHRAEDIHSARYYVEAARKRLQEAEAALCGFGEHDNF
jgi:hypothetical protein